MGPEYFVQKVVSHLLMYVFFIGGTGINLTPPPASIIRFVKNPHSLNLHICIMDASIMPYFILKRSFHSHFSDLAG